MAYSIACFFGQDGPCFYRPGKSGFWREPADMAFFDDENAATEAFATLQQLYRQHPRRRSPTSMFIIDWGNNTVETCTCFDPNVSLWDAASGRQEPRIPITQWFNQLNQLHQLHMFNLPTPVFGLRRGN